MTKSLRKLDLSPKQRHQEGDRKSFRAPRLEQVEILVRRRTFPLKFLTQLPRYSRYLTTRRKLWRLDFDNNYHPVLVWLREQGFPSTFMERLFSFISSATSIESHPASLTSC